MALIELKLEIPASAADATDELLLEHGLARWTVLEDAISKRAWLVGIFPAAEEAEAGWQELRAMLVAAGLVIGVGTETAPQFRPLADADWRDSYKAHFHAWQFGRLHWVPVWEREKFSLPAAHAVLWLDPGLAFGTGNHETTRLCVERLVTLATAAGAEPGDGGRKPEKLHVIDAGCGSGILALSAALLGFGAIAGFDNDPEAVRVSGENAALNALAGRVRFTTADLVTGLAGASADIVLANIQADVLQRFARELVGAVAPGGALVLSGILAHENAQVRATFAAATPGWAVEFRELGEWSDVLLRRPN